MGMNSQSQSDAQPDMDMDGTGRPLCEGIMLCDQDTRGVAMTYPFASDPLSDTCGDAMGDPLQVGQTVNLKIGTGASVPARIVRVFNGGFATQFEFSLIGASGRDAFCQ